MNQTIENNKEIENQFNIKENYAPIYFDIEKINKSN